MRVALLTNFIPPYRLPVFRALAAKVGSLRVLVSTPMEENRAWEVDWSGLDVVVQRTFTVARMWRGVGFRERVQLHVPLDTAGQLARFQPDVIVTGELGARSLAAVRHARRHDVPVILWATLTDQLETRRGRVRGALRRWLLRRADRVIVNGEAGARYIRRFGYPDARIARIPYTTDVRPFVQLPLGRVRGPTRRLLYVGSVSERKGIALLLEALSQMADRQELCLTIVGDGPLRRPLEHHHRHSGVDLEWIGNVPYDELPVWYGKAEFLVFPTLGDEWGLVVNEALAAGLPVIGSRYSQAVEELIRHGENGWVFAPESAEAVREALERALACDPARVAAMQSAARDSVAHTDPAAMADRMFDLIRQTRAEYPWPS